MFIPDFVDEVDPFEIVSFDQLIIHIQISFYH